MLSVGAESGDARREHRLEDSKDGDEARGPNSTAGFELARRWRRVQYYKPRSWESMKATTTHRVAKLKVEPACALSTVLAVFHAAASVQ